MSDELIATARRLAKASPRKPRQADLKRAISTAYYALFHAMAKNGADLLVGAGPQRADKAWAQTYRALDHGFCKNACAAVNGLGFPAEICSCAAAFISLQNERHLADYDPLHRVTRADALAAIVVAESAIRDLKSADKRDRLAFAIQIVLKKR